MGSRSSNDSTQRGREIEDDLEEPPDQVIYQTVTLSHLSNEFRLLSLLPGKFPEPVRCTITQTSLDQESLDYKTLSYVWGDSSVASKIFLNDRTKVVTTNLENALRDLRKEDKPITLWVDALCINQRDLSEKQHQVGLMGKIYSDCSRVYVWLGSQHETASINNGDTNPFEFFRHFAADKHFHELPGFHYDDEKGRYKLFENSDTPLEEQHPLWKGVHHISNSQWWRRSWTVQEAILPPKVTMLHGRWRSSWSTIRSAATNCVKHEFGCCAETYLELPRRITTLMVQVIEHIADIEASRRSPEPLSLLSLTMMFRRKLATDPHDKVFGFLSLAYPEISTQLLPDYSLSVAQTYEKAFRLMVESNPIPFICFIGPRFDMANSEIPVPSWVKNYAVTLSQACVLAENYHIGKYQLYDASCSTRPAITFCDDSTVRIHGFQIGTVRSAATLDESQGDHRRELVQSVVAPAAFLADSLGNVEFATFWRTLFTDVSNFNPERQMRRIAKDDDFFEELRRWLNLGEQNEVMEDLILSLLSRCTYGRAFYTTEDGTLGLGPYDTETGDEVWLFFGSKIPFILRRRPEEEGRYHTFIGDCYLDGVMDGEALNWPTRKDETVILK